MPTHSCPSKHRALLCPACSLYCIAAALSNACTAKLASGSHADHCLAIKQEYAIRRMSSVMHTSPVDVVIVIGCKYGRSMLPTRFKAECTFQPKCSLTDQADELSQCPSNVPASCARLSGNTVTLDAGLGVRHSTGRGPGTQQCFLCISEHPTFVFFCHSSLKGTSWHPGQTLHYTLEPRLSHSKYVPKGSHALWFRLLRMFPSTAMSSVIHSSPKA